MGRRRGGERVFLGYISGLKWEGAKFSTLGPFDAQGKSAKTATYCLFLFFISLSLPLDIYIYTLPLFPPSTVPKTALSFSLADQPIISLITKNKDIISHIFSRCRCWSSLSFSLSLCVCISPPPPLSSIHHRTACLHLERSAIRGYQK
jgi:hypothetical protein